MLTAINTLLLLCSAEAQASRKGRPGPVGTQARCHSLGQQQGSSASMLSSPAAECTNSPTNALDAESDPVFVCRSHKGSDAGRTQSMWCELRKHPSATDTTQKLRRPLRGQCTILILCQLTQTCFLGGGEVWKVFPLATAVCTWSSNSMTTKPPMSTAPNKLSGSFWSPPAIAYNTSI